jgi:hypothetical protein
MPKGVLYAGIILALVAAGASFLVWHSRGAPRDSLTASSTADTPTGSITHTETGPDYTYTNPAYHFSLSFPKDLKVTEFAEKGGGRTITFEESEKIGFQVFIIPYKGTQIAQSRIDLDTHGTAEGTPQQAVIGGVPALIFFSTDPLRGRLREVWILQNGYLYEVTTYDELDSWLAGIMNTWKGI